MGKRLIIKGANFATNSIDRVTPSTVYYTITYNLTNCSASTNSTSIAAGSSYTVTLTPSSGYTIESAAVLHNGVAVSPTSGYTYTISSVSGNITVQCTATAQSANTSTVTYNLTNCTSNNNTTVVNNGTTYTFTLSPNSGYIMDTVTVTHNGVTVSPTSGYSYSISNVQGNIVVTASAIVQSVTYHSGDVSWTTQHYLNAETNTESSSTNYAYTSYINVEGFTSITSINHPEHAVLFYNSSKTFISGWVDSNIRAQSTQHTYADQAYTTTIPEGTCWIRCNSFNKSDTSPLTNWSITISRT
jgi:hypothetical protein